MLSKVVITDSGELPFGVSVKKEDAAFFIPPILYENWVLAVCWNSKIALISCSFPNSCVYPVLLKRICTKCLASQLSHRGFAIIHKTLSFLAGVGLAGLGYVALSDQLTFRVGLRYFIVMGRTTVFTTSCLEMWGTKSMCRMYCLMELFLPRLFHSPNQRIIWK